MNGIHQTQDARIKGPANDQLRAESENLRAITSNWRIRAAPRGPAKHHLQIGYCRSALKRSKLFPWGLPTYILGHKQELLHGSETEHTRIQVAAVPFVELFWPGPRANNSRPGSVP